MFQKLAKAKTQELETEEHMRIMAVQEKERLTRLMKKLNKDLDETRDQCSVYEVFNLNSTQYCDQYYISFRAGP